MSKPLVRVLRFSYLLALGLYFLTGSARADLVWNAQTGWRVDGGVLSGLTGTEGRNALDLMNKARAAEEKENYASAASTYEKIAKKYINSIYAPEALYRAARARLARKQYNKAFEDFQEVIRQYPNTKRFNEIIGEQYRITSALLDGARNRIFWGLIPSFTNREKAVQNFEVVLNNAPYSDYAPLALMNITRGHQRLGNHEEAIDALDRLINNYPQHLLLPDAYLKLAQTHASLVEGPEYDQASSRDATSYYEDFMILFPNDPNVSAAAKGASDMKTMLASSKVRMGDFYFYKRDNYTAAKVLYNEAITVYPDSEIAVLARKKLVAVEAKATGKPAPANAPSTEPKKKRFWLF